MPTDPPTIDQSSTKSHPVAVVGATVSCSLMIGFVFAVFVNALILGPASEHGSRPTAGASGAGGKEHTGVEPSGAGSTDGSVSSNDGGVSPPVETETPSIVVQLPLVAEQLPLTIEFPPEPSPADIAAGKPAWHELLDQPGEPRPFQDVCFETFDTSKSLPQRDQLLKWFEPVAGSSHRFYDTRTQLGQCGAIEGLVRLKAPLWDDTALRMWLESYNRLQIHCYHGTQGVTLVYYEDQSYRWAAYATTRKPGTAKPETFALTATDDGRSRRSEIRAGGTIELRYRDGELILSRGDVALVRARLPGSPDDVYFDGKAAFHGITLVRTTGGPPQNAQHPIVAEIERPADLPWTEQLHEGAKVERLPDGSIELAANQAKQRGWIATPLPKHGLHEVILEVEDATPGSSLCLTRADGQPPQVIRWMRNQRDGRTCLTMRGNDDAYQAEYGAINERIVAYASPRQFVRLLFGCGQLRWWISADGVNWAEPEEPVNNLPGGISHIGLFHVTNVPDVRITLRRITLRELSELSSLADAAVREQARPFNDARGLGIWITAATESQPAETDLAEWRRACAIRALGAGCAKELGWQLVDLLLDDAAARKLPPDKQLRMLEEAVLLYDTRDNQEVTVRMIERFDRLAIAAYEQHGERPFSLIRHALMTAPFSLLYNFRVATESTVRAELLQLLYSGRWQETVDFCRRLRFYQQHQQCPLAEWAEMTALRELPTRPGATSVARQKEDWRQPLVEELSKDAYNLLAELQAVLDSDAYDDAARMITAADPDSMTGVAPFANDRQLLVSLPASIRLAIRQYPQLETVMTDRYGPLAQLRVRQAIAAGNVAAVQLAAVQFESTEAAAEAHRWLGDRALSSGWFARALAEYRRAELTAGAALKQELAARIRLAAAMLGDDVGTAATQPVQLGEIHMPAAEFETLVAEMRQRADGSPAARSAAVSELAFASPAPQPTGYEVHVRGRLDGQVGDEPKAEVTRHVGRYKVDWADRQLATVVVDDVLYVSNRFQVAAYDLNDGQRKWQSPPPAGRMMRSQEWTLTPMPPLITHRYIFVRQLYGNGPVLVCLDKQSGQIVWTADQRSSEYVVSDPLLVQDQLMVLTLFRTDQQQGILRLAVFDADTGEVLRQHDVARLRDAWWSRKYCRATALDDSIVAALGGVVVCCDTSGGLRWVRKQVVLPVEEESRWVTQYFDRPWLRDRRLYVAQPGVRVVECLDPDTGNRHWNTLVLGVQRLIGFVDESLIVQTDDGLTALDLKTGSVKWTHAAADMLEGHLCGGDGGIMYSRREPDDNNANRFRPRLVWLDSQTGRATGSSPLTTLDDEDPRLGPLVPHKDRLWTFFGRGQNDANRDLLELIPQGEADEPPTTATSPDLWTRHVPAVLREAATKVLPDWQLLDGQTGPNTGLRSDVHGEKDALGIVGRLTAPATLAREITISPGTKPKLRIRVTDKAKQQCKLIVRFAGSTVFERKLNSPEPAGAWQQCEVDLSKIAGQRGWLVVEAFEAEGGESTTIYWRTLEVVY